MPLTRGWIANRWSMLVLRGSAALVFGLLALASPRSAVTALVFLFALYAIVDGVTSSLFALASPRDATKEGRPIARNVYLARGVLGICVGALAFLQPELTSLVFVVLAGTWAATAGLSELALAVRLHRDGVVRVAGLIVAGVATLGLGVLLLFAPSLGLFAIGGLVAFLALLSGIASLSVAARLHDQLGGDAAVRAA